MRRATLAAAVLLAGQIAWAQQSAPTPARQREGGAQPVKIDAATAAKILTETYKQTKDAKTREDFGYVIEVCERALAANPPEKIRKYAHQLAAWGYNRRGETYADEAATLFNQGARRQANELDALALDDFQAALRHDPEKWKALHNRGVSLALHGKIDEALTDFGRVLQINPDFTNSRFNRAEIRAQQELWPEAIADYSEVLRLKASDTEALLGRGNAQLKLGKHQEALADFQQALAYAPTSAAAYAGRGDVYTALGQWNAAGEDYRQAIKLDPKLGRAFRGAAWLMATCPLEQFRASELALQSAEKAIELAGDGDWTYLDALAAAQASAGRFTQAQATLEKAIQLAPDKAVGELQSRLELYRSRQPYRQSERSAAAGNAAVAR
jgi:tetratricopeptide (TPR) repeat protein